MGAGSLIRRIVRLVLYWLAFITFLATFAYTPISRYRPGCYRGEKEETEFSGPMRSVYVDQWAEVLEDDGMPYYRVGNEIFFRFADSLGLSDAKPWPFSFEDLLLNWEWRIAYNIALGYGPGDSRIEPPPILLDLAKRHQEYLKRTYPDLEDAWSLRGTFDGNCELIRAAAIRIEDLPPGSLPPLPDSLPPSMEPPPQSTHR